MPVTVSGTATNGVDYTTIPDSVLFEPGDTTYTIPIEIIEDAIDEGLETIVLYVELGCAIGFGDSLVINVLDYLPIEVSADTIICPGGNAVLSATGADTYTWSPAAGLSSTTGATVNASPDEPTTYSVEGTLYACVSSSEIFVDVEFPVATADPDTTIFFGETATLGATGGVSYNWTPAGTLDNPNAQFPNAFPLETTTYNVTITTALGCTATDQMTVFVSGNAEVWVPNAFSPNNDGYNDNFTIVVRGQLSFFELAIYNRWGEQVYLGSLGSAGWDGMYNDIEQPMGAYVYTLKWTDTEGNTTQEQGQFTLVR